MRIEQRKAVELLYSKFEELHKALLLKNEFALADKLIAMYQQAQTKNYIAGMDYIMYLNTDFNKQ